MDVGFFRCGYVDSWRDYQQNLQLFTICIRISLVFAIIVSQKGSSTSLCYVCFVRNLKASPLTYRSREFCETGEATGVA